MKLYGALDLGGTNLDTAVVDENGRILTSRSCRIESLAFDAERLTKLLASEIYYTHEQESVLCTVALPFVVGKDQKLYNASNIASGISMENLQQCLLKHYGVSVPLFFINDVRAAAMGELWLGALQDHKEGSIYVNIGTGLSMTTVIHGTLVTGAHNYAGEIAFCLSNIDELASHANRKFPLEEQVSGKALSQIMADAPTSSMKELFQMASIHQGKQSPDLKESFDRVKQMFTQLAMHLINVCCVLNPSIIVFGGGVAKDFALFAPLIQECMASHIPFVPKLEYSQLGEQAGLLGAASWGMQQSTGKTIQ